MIGSRVESGNCDVVKMWSLGTSAPAPSFFLTLSLPGCQWVSMNFQGGGTQLSLNNAKFRENGNCGYVLKPPYLRLKKETYLSDGKVESERAASASRLRVTVTIFSARHLRKQVREATPDRTGSLILGGKLLFNKAFNKERGKVNVI